MHDPSTNILQSAAEPDLPVASVSSLAVVSLILGVLALTAFINPVLWCMPILAAVVSLAAIRQIHRYWPELAGRPLAWMAFGLALLAGVGAPTHIWVRNWIAATEAQRFASVFFDFLSNDEPQHAFQLTLESEVRQPLDDRLWAKYLSSSERSLALREFVDEPVVKALLTLGKKAEVRFYETETHERRGGQELYKFIYAVTYTDDAGQRRSFFARLALVRRRDTSGEFGWFTRIGGPIRPAAFAQTASP